MKTQKEIEKMKGDIQSKIESISSEINSVCVNQLDYPPLERLIDRKNQLMAQYNILLEVLR